MSEINPVAISEQFDTYKEVKDDPYGAWAAIQALTTALSSAAVAEREPLGWVLPDAVEFLRKGQQESRPSSTPLHNMPNDEMGWNVALYLDPPPVSELEAENARLRLAYNTVTSAAHIAATRAEAAEARLAEALEAIDALVDLNDKHSPFGGELYQDRIDRAWDAARRIRDGGQADG